MTVPTRREAASLLLSLEPPPWFLAHACAVADVAGWVAAAVNAHGGNVDAAATEAAALLHDVDKLPAVGCADGVRHGEGSAAWLVARGMDELAAIVRDHPVTRLAGVGDRARLAAAPLEARIVAYADKRAGQRLGSMDQRFASWRRRYPEVPAAGAASVPAAGAASVPAAGGGTGPRRAPWTVAEVEAIHARAQDLEREVCAAAGAQPAGVRRLRWSRRALRAAAR